MVYMPPCVHGVYATLYTPGYTYQATVLLQYTSRVHVESPVQALRRGVTFLTVRQAGLTDTRRYCYPFHCWLMLR